MGTSRNPPRLANTLRSSFGSTKILFRQLLVTNLRYDGNAVSERVFLVRENLRRRTRDLVDDTDNSEVFPLGSVMDLLAEDSSVVLCSCVTVSLWLSSD